MTQVKLTKLLEEASRHVKKELASKPDVVSVGYDLDFIQLRSVGAVEGEGLGAPLAWSEDLRRLHAEMAEGPDARAS